MILSLGTVQLGVRYGVNNGTGMLNEADAQELLKTAWSAGFSMLDTSSEYGLAEQRIGEFRARHPGTFKVVAKYNAEYSPDVIEALKAQSRARMGMVDYSMVYSVGGSIAALDRAAADGVSVYTVEEAEAATGFKMVQVPGSILDGRMDEMIFRLQERGQMVLVRSLLVQGLLAANPNIGPQGNTGNAEFVTEGMAAVARLRKIAADYEMSVVEMAVRWAWELDPDVAIIGCETPEQAWQTGEYWKRGPLPKDLVNWVKEIRREIPEVVYSPVKWGQRYDFTPYTA